MILASPKDVIVQLGIWPCLIVVAVVLWSMFGFPIKWKKK